MPCDTVQTSTVEWKASTDSKLLFQALEALRLSPRAKTYGSLNFIEFRGGTYDPTAGQLDLQARDPEALTKQIKQAYSAEVVKSQAKRFGWLLKETAPFKYQIVKR